MRATVRGRSAAALRTVELPLFRRRSAGLPNPLQRAFLQLGRPHQLRLAVAYRALPQALSAVSRCPARDAPSRNGARVVLRSLSRHRARGTLQAQAARVRHSFDLPRAWKRAAFARVEQALYPSLRTLRLRGAAQNAAAERRQLPALQQKSLRLPVSADDLRNSRDAAGRNDARRAAGRTERPRLTKKLTPMTTTMKEHPEGTR